MSGLDRPWPTRVTLYADLTTEKRDNLPANRQSTGWDIGIKHNF